MFDCSGSSFLHTGFSLVRTSGGYSLVVAHGLLTVVVSLVAEHRLYSVWASGVVAHGLKLPHGMWDLLEQGSYLRPLHLQIDSYPLDNQGSLSLFDEDVQERDKLNRVSGSVWFQFLQEVTRAPSGEAGGQGHEWILGNQSWTSAAIF